jgi:monoterpene epsilon-lactone hydrolase
MTIEITPGNPSLTSRAIVLLMNLSGLKKRQFNPLNWTGPKAKPRKPDAFVPPSSLSNAVTVERSSFEDWPVYTLTPPGGGSSGSLLYLHGGAYAAEILSSHWAFLGKLAVATNRTITVPIYPLAPEHTHVDVFPTLTRLYREFAAGKTLLAVAGDSAGGGMALALIQSLPPDIRRPRDLILLSPWLDATMSNPDIAAVAPTDPLLSLDHVTELGRLYAGTDDTSVPTVSPINGPLDRLGNVTVYSGTREILNPDARRFVAKATNAGAKVTLRESPGMIHDWALLPIPEAKATLADVVARLEP